MWLLLTGETIETKERWLLLTVETRQTTERWLLLTVQTRETRERWLLLTVETRETRERWLLLTVETVVNGDLKSTNERGPFFDWFLGLVMPVQEIFVLPWLLF